MSQLPFESIQRNILVKKEFETSGKFGCDPDKRPIEKLIDLGVSNIDKPAGPTSHQVSAYAKQIMHMSKAGHSGTLDPNVTGVLAVAYGRATRVTQALLTAGKEYVCIMHLHADITEEKIRKACNEFLGTISQLPPLKSAVKRQVRERDIYYLDIIEIDGREVLFKVGCEAGTYIRKLCTDIGKKLGTQAHMAELRRTKAGPFSEKTIITLQQLQDAYTYWKEDGNEKQLRKCILPVENAVTHLPKIWISDYAVESLCHGSPLHIPGISKLHDSIKYNDPIAIMTIRGELVALGTAKMNSQEIMMKERGVTAVVDAVFMEEGTYPKVTRKD